MHGTMNVKLRPYLRMSMQKYFKGRYHKILSDLLFTVTIFIMLKRKNIKYKIIRPKYFKQINI